MKKNLFYIIIISSLILVSCKKKDDTPAPAPTSNNGTTTGGTPTPLPNGSGTTNYDGLLEVFLSSTKYGGTYLSPTTLCKALLCAITVTNEAYLNLQNMGTVSLNGVTFANHLGANNYYYIDSTYANIPSPYVWSVSGSPNISASSFTNTTAFPIYTASLNLPASLSKSTGITVSLTGLSGCDFVQLMIVGPTGSQFLSAKTMPGNSDSIGYSSSELNSINTGTNGYFLIRFFKDNVQDFNGKKINIRSGTSYSMINFSVVN